MANLNGSCLCGAVSFLAPNASSHVRACHCEACRRWVGGPLMVVEGGEGVSFTGEQYIGIFDSSDWAERGFCMQCGSSLFFRLKQSGRVALLAGLLADSPNLAFDQQVFVDERPAYYQFANRTDDMTGAECFAHYAANNPE